MRSLSAGFATSVAGRATRLGHLMAITMPDGTVKRFNSFGEPSFTWSGQTWTGYPGFNISALNLSDGQTPPAVEISRGIGTAGLLTFTEAASGIASGATVDLYIVDFISGASHELGSKWRIGRIDTTREGTVTFGIVSLARRNRQLFLRRYKPGCQHQLGDAGCGKDLTAFTETVTVVTNADLYTLTVTTASSPAPADDYFNNGALKFTSGDMAGTSYDVRDWVQSTGTIKLFSPLKGLVTAGDTATVHAGCDKTTGAAGCARFDNIARRFAFDHLPDDQLDYPAVQEPAPAPPPDGGGGLFLRYGGGGGGAFG